MRFAAAALLAATIVSGCAKKEPANETQTAQTGGTETPPIAAPQAILDMIAAHGGMDPWRAAPTVSFEDEFNSPGYPPTVSRVTVEQGTRRAYLDYPVAGASASWDGHQAWSMNWDSPYPPRFILLLNYYFLNLPWLTMDPGVKLSEPGTGRLPDDPVEYITVTMTFEPGTGDTPDDYYRLYIDPATRRLRACAYIVTYQALLPEGESAMPENVLVYDEFATVNGLLVPVKYTIYLADRSPLASCTIRDWAFDRPFDAARMSRPIGSVVDASTP